MYYDKKGAIINAENIDLWRYTHVRKSNFQTHEEVLKVTLEIGFLYRTEEMHFLG